MMNLDSIDVEGLRKELIEHIETEAYLMPIALADLNRAYSNDIEELIILAKECGINYLKYFK